MNLLNPSAGGFRDRRRNSIQMVLELEDMLVEILIRVPVKAVFKFKCVSKRWLNLISDPSFARAYVSIREEADRSPPWTLLYQYPPSRFIRSPPPLEEKLNRIASDVDKPPGVCSFHSEFRDFVLACSEGLLLLSRSSEYVVCNPVTGERLNLPTAPCHLGRRIEGFATKSDKGSVYSYRVVLMELRNEPSDAFCSDVFCSESGEWERFTVRSAKPVKLLPYGPRVLNGVLLWFDDELRLVGYDPYDRPEACDVIWLPRFRNAENWARLDEGLCLCDASGGSLRFFHVNGDDGDCASLLVWELVDYGSGEWRLQHKVPLNPVVWRSVRAVPLASHPLDPDIVYLWCLRGVVVCNTRTGTVEDHNSECTNAMLQASSVCKFVLLWPSKIPVSPLHPPQWSTTRPEAAHNK